MISEIKKKVSKKPRRAKNQIHPKKPYSERNNWRLFKGNEINDDFYELTALTRRVISKRSIPNKKKHFLIFIILTQSILMRNFCLCETDIRQFVSDFLLERSREKYFVFTRFFAFGVFHTL